VTLHSLEYALICSLLLPVSVLSQQARPQNQARQEKLDEILRIQDLRTPHDSELVGYLTDEDPVVRFRATLAYGSIQDTSVLSLLQKNLTEGPDSLQEVAAFAIGQTGMMLSDYGRATLEHEILWIRIPETRAAERMIEELGKFGTKEGLRDLITRIGNVYPLRHTRAVTMCIARYAIRGIVTDDGIRYLLQFVRPTEQTSWEVAYALQRVGDSPMIRQELDQLALLTKHTDPLVRMNIALLLGKLRDAKSSLYPLTRLAESDPDWRVRVNALRALGGFSVRAHPEIVDILRRASFDANDHVVLTALTAVGTTDLDVGDTSSVTREEIGQLRFIAENRSNNFPWQHQGAAARSYATLAGPTALPSVWPTTWPEPRLKAQLLEAVAATGSDEAGAILVEASGSTQPAIVCAALGGLARLVERRPTDTTLFENTYSAFVHALSSEDVAVRTTAASQLGDSLFRRATSVDPLLRALGNLRVPDDIEAMQEIIATLGKLGDPRATSPLLTILRTSDRSVALAAAEALTRITGSDYRNRLREWYQPLLTDFDFAYLHALPRQITVSLSTSRGEILLELDRDAAPFTIMSMLKLSEHQQFYSGLAFHRVVSNFVVQGGDPRGDGWGGPGYTIRSEFSMQGYGTGTVGIASAGKDTEGSQFFITHSPQPHLDGRYTVIGRVISGQDVVDRLQIGDTISSWIVQQPSGPTKK
jgi:cyclophilin family peptidyl-prolyl cis-trans isomerase/HEAT repeat protein